MFTTTRPKFWFGLTFAVLAVCCFCGGGLTCVGLQGAKEVAWFAAARTAAEAAVTPSAAEMSYVRRLQAGEKLSPELLAGLEDTARSMAAKTRKGWEELDKQEAPERLTNMKAIAKQGFSDLEKGWTEMAEAIKKRDPEAARIAYVRMQRLGDQLKEDVNSELKRLYSREGQPSKLSGSDPAAPSPGGQPGNP